MHMMRRDTMNLLAALGLAWTHHGAEVRVPTLRLRVVCAPGWTRRTMRAAGTFVGDVLGASWGDGLILREGRAVFIDGTDGYAGVSAALLVACRDCGGWFFVGEAGCYRCRYCGAHDGHAHLHDVHDVMVRDGRITLVDVLGLAVSVADFAADVRADAA